MTENKEFIKDCYVSLKTHFDEKFRLIEVATVLAREAVNVRLESMNEFRNQLKDQMATFLTRAEYDINHEHLAEDIKLLNKSKDNLEGKASQTSVNIGYVISLVGWVIAIIALLKK